MVKYCVWIFLQRKRVKICPVRDQFSKDDRGEARQHTDNTELIIEKLDE